MLSSHNDDKTESLDKIIPRNEVSESKTETEAVTIARMSHETNRFYVVSFASIVIALLIICFLMFNYTSATPDNQGKIVATLIAVLSTAIGVFIGKKV